MQTFPEGSWYFGKFLNLQMPSVVEQSAPRQDKRDRDPEEPSDDEGSAFGACGLVG